ncbi:ORF6N domain-containing protein [Opitutus sp. ER46]|uniref:ORF6N domain-containing protein n=1 Tax=Opitutus sp. ER46 TaxID=2161864 RepID=UPI000D318417|nr:ORF6N domain-containing protein [Opitutus sp. ER46]PTX97751.1 DNA-binding protein [Opitutus sp. ER46]
MARTPNEPVLPTILTVRGRKVVSDADLARLYGVPTKRLNEAVRRNRARFPDDFAFALTAEEFAGLRSQFATAKGRGGRRTIPQVFTEHGALMAASVLNSRKAVQMSIYLVRAFVQMRDEMLTSSRILKRLAEIDRRLIEHDSVLREIIDRLQPLLDAPEAEEPVKPKIGFHPGNR